MSFHLRGHSSKTRANYRISQAMNKNGKKSQAEILFNEYQESRGLNLIWGKELPFFDPTTRQIWKFECDFLRPLDGGSYDIDFEIDGEQYHQTKELNGHEVPAGKDAWKDNIKNNCGLKVIHIRTISTKRKWWYYLDEMLPKALISKQPSVVIPA